MMMNKNSHNETGYMGNIGHDMGTEFDMQMQESCGNVTALSSKKLIEVCSYFIDTGDFGDSNACLVSDC